MNTQDIIDIIDPNQPKFKRNLLLIYTIACLLIVVVFSKILQLNGFPPLLILLVIPLLIGGTFLHELFHYFPLWYFSRARPHLGFTSMGLFSALSSGSFITRNQAIVCALAPTFILTTIILITALFASFLLKILLLAWLFSDLVTSYSDFYLTYRLLKNPTNCLYKNVNNTSVLFIPKS